MLRPAWLGSTENRRAQVAAQEVVARGQTAAPEWAVRSAGRLDRRQGTDFGGPRAWGCCERSSPDRERNPGSHRTVRTGPARAPRQPGLGDNASGTAREGRHGACPAQGDAGYDAAYLPRR